MTNRNQRRMVRGKCFKLVEKFLPEKGLTPRTWAELPQPHKERLYKKAQLRQSEGITPQSTPSDSSESERPTSKLSTAEARREYQRRYYQMHKEKAKEYQRQYNLTHKKKARGGRGKSGFAAPREVVRTTFNTADIMAAPVEKTVKMLEKIFKGDRLFTM